MTAVEFSGIVKSDKAHYGKHIHGGEEYVWKTGDIAIWDVGTGTAIGIAYYVDRTAGDIWAYPAELRKLREYLCIYEYTPENADRLANALKGWRLDDFTMEKWFDDKNEPRISVTKRDINQLVSISTFGIF